MHKEEIIWFQKARTEWMNDGDRNTTYYHTKTTVRRRRNRVTRLKDESNGWLEGDHEIGALVHRYFKTLFSEEEERRDWIDTEHLWPTVPEGFWNDVGQDICGEEIKRAMFSIGGLKAPGSDGFPALFFNRIGESLEEV